MTSNLFFSGRYNRGYTLPSFNDLYWPRGGNPDLKPEVSNEFDLLQFHSICFWSRIISKTVIFYHGGQKTSFIRSCQENCNDATIFNLFFPKLAGELNNSTNSLYVTALVATTFYITTKTLCFISMNKLHGTVHWRITVYLIDLQ